MPVRLTRRLSLLCLAGLLAACGGSDPPAEPVAYQLLFNEFASRAFPEATHVVRNQAQLDALWASGQPWVGLGVPAPQEAPAIDFSRNTLVGVTLGLGYRCYIPEILSVTRRGDTLTVVWRTNRDRQITTSACRHEFTLNSFLTVPVWPGPVVFDYRAETPVGTPP